MAKCFIEKEDYASAENILIELDNNKKFPKKYKKDFLTLFLLMPIKYRLVGGWVEPYLIKFIGLEFLVDTVRCRFLHQ